MKTISGAILSFAVVCVGSPVIITKSKKNKYKEKLGKLGIIEEKVGKQGRSPTPADILVIIKSLLQSLRMGIGIKCSLVHLLV